MSTDSANLLIISDLHLGEDIRPGSSVGSLKHLVKLERALERFIAHYTSQRIGDRPWRLVINGDMVDFLSVCLLPAEGETEAFTPTEYIFGLGSHPRAARLKLERVLERHERVFRTLAEFVAAGHHVDVVVGNHDIEFSWPIVQATFREGVARLAPAGAVGVAERINFHPWFYFEENVAWVEHGHQYDGYCSFDYQLHPAVDVVETPDSASDLFMNVASAGLRFVTNRAGGYQPGQEAWAFTDYVRWTISTGFQGIARIAHGFYTMSTTLIGMWRRFGSPEAMARRKARHLARLKDLADQFRLSSETLLAVDELRREPVVANLGRLLAAIMLDRLALYAGAAMLIMVAWLALPWTWAAGAVLGTVVTSTVVSRRLERSRESLDPTPTMHRVCHEIRARVHARYVVMGHTHEPQAVPLPEGGMYFNTGTWVHHEHVPAPGAAAAASTAPAVPEFTHVVIRHEDTGPVAKLCAWKDGRSLEIEAKS